MSLLDDPIEVGERADIDVIMENIHRLTVLYDDITKNLVLLKKEQEKLQNKHSDLSNQITRAAQTNFERYESNRIAINNTETEQHFITKNYLTHVMNLSWILHDVLDYISKKYPEDEHIRKTMDQVQNIEKENYNYLNLWDDEMDKMLKGK